MTIEEFTESYCFYGDGGTYTPQEHEQVIIADAIHAYFGHLIEMNEKAYEKALETFRAQYLGVA